MNEGTGPAKDFHIRCDGMILESEDDSFDKFTHFKDIDQDDIGFKVSSYEIPLLKTKTRVDLNDFADISHHMKRQIGSAEILRSTDQEWYKHTSELGWHVSDDSSCGSSSESFSEVITRLNDAGIEKVCFQLTLIYSDITDSLEAKNILAVQVDVGKNLTAEQAIADARISCNIDTTEILKDVNSETIHFRN